MSFGVLMKFFSTKKIRGIKDWTRQLAQFCTDSDLSFNECNFHVTAVRTLLKKDDTELPQSFFKDDYDQTKEEIYQIFDVEVTPSEYDFSKLSFTFNGRHIEATLILKEGFLVDDGENYIPQLSDFIISSLIQRKVIIVSRKSMRSRIEKIIADNFNPPCTIVEERRFTFLRSKPSNTHKGFTNLLKKRWCKENKEDAILGALYAVSEGEPIGFFLKDPIVVSGRNLKGEFIDMKQISMNTPQQTDDNNGKVSKDHQAAGMHFRYKVPPEAGSGIKKTEEGGVVKYEAQDKGIVRLGETDISLMDIVTLQQVSVKTGCILGGYLKGIEIDVDCKDNSKDAVQIGAIIEAEVVNIKGNIGERVVIRSKQLNISGQTHQSALIYAEEASITIHKGILHGNSIDVDNLEGGKIYGKNVNVLNTQGGRIVGSDVVISKMHSNNSIQFSRKLHLKAVHGSENQISFDIFADRQQRQILSTIIQRDALLRSNIAARVAHCKSLANKLHKIKPIIENLRPLIDRSKKEGFELEAGTKKTLGFYVMLLRQIKEQKDYANKLQKVLVENAHKGEDTEKLLNEAKVTTESGWKDNNIIVLTRRYPPSEKRIFAKDSEMFDVYINDDGDLDKDLH
ncbi:putative ATPase [Helicobacter muridarum]|nr:putative ATPase [Helicobacter muridarum]